MQNKKTVNRIQFSSEWCAAQMCRCNRSSYLTQKTKFNIFIASKKMKTSLSLVLSPTLLHALLLATWDPWDPYGSMTNKKFTANKRNSKGEFTLSSACCADSFFATSPLGSLHTMVVSISDFHGIYPCLSPEHASLWKENGWIFVPIECRYIKAIVVPK